MNYGVFSANEWLYTDTNAEDGQKVITISSAQNSYGCVQILLKGTNAISLSFESDNLPSPEINRLISVYVDKNSDDDYNSVVAQGTPIKFSTRLAPFYVYDAMELVDNQIEADANNNIALYLRWSTAELDAGKYNGKICFSNEFEEKCEIPVEFFVANVKIPQKETLRLTNWFSIMAISTFHNVEYLSEEHWDLIEKYGKLMREAHQTDFWIPVEILDFKVDDKGNYIFDFKNTERLIRLYLSLGFTHIEGPLFVKRFTWHHKDLLVNINGKRESVFSRDGYPFLVAFFTQLYDFLIKNNWFNIFSCHVADEPSNHCADDYRILSGIIRKYMPGVKIIEAVEIPDLDGAVDIWVPKADVYINNKSKFDSKKQYGDEVWFYTCMFPGGNYLNRFLDRELIRTRYIHWANFIYGLTGYLHWGLNMYLCVYKGDVFTGACGEEGKRLIDILPAGDTHILYPKGEKILRSARFEMMRAGCEDYELLKLLEAQDTEKAKTIANKCIRSFTDYEKNIDIFENVHRELLESFSNF